MTNNLFELYRVEELPIFQNRMYDSETEAKECPRGEMRLVENRETGLVYNTSFCSELMAYDSHYQNEQGVSLFFREHLEIVASIVGRIMGHESLVEVGCGKGLFLEILLNKGFDITGFDPIYEGTNPRIKHHYFKQGSNIKANGIILRHVLEHIQNPVDFLFDLKDANGGTGLIYIEVPCFEWICSHRTWFDVFYEHVNYFRISDFYRIFGKVIESGRLMGDQYIYIVADLASLKKPIYDKKNPLIFPKDFLHHIGEQNLSASIWGGASKGVIFSLLKERTGNAINTVIDINPAKQGKFLPGTGLRVQSPAEAMLKLTYGDSIYVMNSVYLDEIKKLTNNHFNLICIDYE